MSKFLRSAAIVLSFAVSAAAFSCSSSDSSGGRESAAETSTENTTVSETGTEAVTGTGAVSMPELTVTFLDIGKADSIIINGSKSTVVIDCGEKGDGKDIVKFLEKRGVTSIDYLIITHYDKDHVGGAAKVINNFDVQNVLAPDYSENSPETEKYNDALKKNKITPQLLTENLSFELDGAQYTVFAPEQTYYGPDNDNDFSLVTRLDYNDASFVFAGDAMEQRLSEVMDIGDCDLLKLPYHGRRIGNLEEFLDASTPEYVVVCTSKEEFSAYTQNSLKDKKIPFWSTCFNGDITAVTNGETITVTCEKGTSKT